MRYEPEQEYKTMILSTMTKQKKPSRLVLRLLFAFATFRKVDGFSAPIINGYGATDSSQHLNIAFVTGNEMKVRACAGN
jgi:hypothetical protein